MRKKAQHKEKPGKETGALGACLKDTTCLFNG